MRLLNELCFFRREDAHLGAEHVVVVECDVIEGGLERLDLIGERVFEDRVNLYSLCDGAGNTALRAGVGFAANFDGAVVDEDGGLRDGVCGFQFRIDDQTQDNAGGRIDSHGAVIRNDSAEGVTSATAVAPSVATQQ